MVEKIEFDGRTAARPTRKDPKIKPFLSDQDDARTGTVILKDGTPDRVIEKVVGEAAESREKNAEKFGQTELTDRERKEIDFTKTDVPTARAVKGIANGSLDTSNLFTDFAADEEADRAFVQAEDQRSQSSGLLETESSSQAGLGGDVVESDQQSAFALETDVREAQGRESRQDVAQASEFGVDDRELDNSGSDEGDQSGLEVFGGGSRDNQTLF
jgi:hypothetical protein